MRSPREEQTCSLCQWLPHVPTARPGRDVMWKLWVPGAVWDMWGGHALLWMRDPFKHYSLEFRRRTWSPVGGTEAECPRTSRLQNTPGLKFNFCMNSLLGPNPHRSMVIRAGSDDPCSGFHRHLVLKSSGFFSHRCRREDPGVPRCPFQCWMCSMPDLFFIEFVFVQYEVQKHTCLKDSSCICMYFIVRQQFSEE